MKSLLSRLFNRKQKAGTAGYSEMTVDESLHNITEGGEFLDDLIRVKEQPFVYPDAEKRITPESLESLWW